MFTVPREKIIIFEIGEGAKILKFWQIFTPVGKRREDVKKFNTLLDRAVVYCVEQYFSKVYARFKKLYRNL